MLQSKDFAWNVVNLDLCTKNWPTKLGGPALPAGAGLVALGAGSGDAVVAVVAGRGDQAADDISVFFFLIY